MLKIYIKIYEFEREYFLNLTSNFWVIYKKLQKKTIAGQ